MGIKTKLKDLAFRGEIMAIMLAACMVFLMLLGCTKKIYTTVTENSSEKYEASRDSAYEARVTHLTDMIEKAVNVRDSVVIRDSVIVIRNEVGETIYKEVIRESSRDRNTVTAVQRLQERFDSINEQRQKEVTMLLEELRAANTVVEKEKSRWDKLKEDAGSIALGILAAALAAVLTWLVIRKKK